MPHASVDIRIESGDTVLKDKQCAIYLSKTSQNKLLECMGNNNNILTKILDVKASNRFFGLEADEVADTSGWEQLGLALRYVKDNKPVERLVSFIACESVTGAAICTTILDAMMEQAACQVIGCQAMFRESAPKATYIVSLQQPSAKFGTFQGLQSSFHPVNAI